MNRLIILITVMFFYVGGFAQTNKNKTYKKQGNLVSVTSYFENGQIKEQGFYKNKKLHGEWSRYDENGKRIVLAYYSKGIKTGVWKFITNGVISKVNYSNNKISNVTYNPTKFKVALQ